MKRVIVLLVVLALVSTVANSDVPGTSHRAAAQQLASAADTVTIDFADPTQDGSSVVSFGFSFYYGGPAYDSLTLDTSNITVSWDAAGGSVSWQTDSWSGNSIDTSNPDALPTGYTVIFDDKTATAADSYGYDYRLRIIPEGGNKTAGDEWDWGDNDTWRVVITHADLSTNAFQFNAAISAGGGTLNDPRITALTPNRTLAIVPTADPSPFTVETTVANDTYNLPAPLAQTESETIGFSTDDPTDPNDPSSSTDALAAAIKWGWNLDGAGTVSPFAGVVGFDGTGNSPDTVTFSGDLGIAPTAEPADPSDIHTLTIWAVDSVSDEDSGRELNSELTYIVNAQVKNPTLVVTAPSLMSTEIGTQLDAVVELSNSGGGSIDVSATLSGYNWQTDAGYFTVSFDDFGAINPDALDIVFEHPPVDLNVRFIPTHVTTSSESLTLDYTSTPDVTPGDDSANVALSGEGLEPEGRDNFAFVTVLDRSGSMGSTATYPTGTVTDLGAPAVTKMDGLHVAGDLFYEIMGTFSTSSDATGVISYNHDPNSELALAGADAAQIGDAQTTISNLDDSGSTSISEALDMAVNWLEGATQSRKSILLMTDGRHNTPNWDLAGDFNDIRGVTNGVPGPLQTLLHSIQMYVVGLGDDGVNLEGDELRKIARGYQTNGDAEAVYQFSLGGYRQSQTIDRLSIFFAQVLADNFFEIPVDDPLVLPLDGSVTALIPINSSTDAAMFYITWPDPRVRLTFTLSDPLGVSQWKSINRPGYAFVAIEDMRAFCEHHRTAPGGDWKLDIWINSTIGEGEPPGEVSVEYAGFISDRVIRSDFSIDTGNHTTGSPVLVSAHLTEAGRPIVGATCTVLASVPLIGLGEFIYNNQIRGDTQVAVESSDGGADRPEVQYLDQLLAEMPDAIERVIIPLSLNDNGTGGDIAAGDGRYSLMLAAPGEETETEHNGIYTFQFFAEGTTLLGEPFRRTSAISDYVVSVLDQSETTGNVYVQSPSSAYVSFVARDRFGNMLDPVQGRSYQVVAVDPESLDFKATQVAGRMDGSVTFQLTPTRGSFSPYARPETMIQVEAFPLFAPDATVAPMTTPAAGGIAPIGFSVPAYAPLLSGEIVLGYLALPATLPTIGGISVGARGRINLGQIVSPEVELVMTKPGLDPTVPETIIQFGGNVVVNIPVMLGPLRPYVTLGGGGMAYTQIAGDSLTGVISGGIGARWYPNWRMAGGLSVEVRDLLQFNPFGLGLTNSFQVLIAGHVNGL